MSHKLSLQQCQDIIDGAIQAGQKKQAPPLTIAVLDDGGHLKAFQRQDQASMMRPEIAIAKAWGAIGMGMSSRDLSEVAQQRPDFVNALTTMAQGQLMPVPGGVLILNQQKEVIGAVGISGDTSDNDEQYAIAGIASAELCIN